MPAFNKPSSYSLNSLSADTPYNPLWSALCLAIILPFHYTQRFWFCEAENHIFQANFCVLFCHLATGRNKAICHAVDGILTKTLLT